MNRRARKLFEVGQDVAGARVLEIVDREPPRSLELPNPSRRLAYRVVCANCGHERVIRHSALIERLASGATGCRACTRKTREIGEKVKAKATPKTALSIALGAWR
jgi:hypothetical protein